MMFRKQQLHPPLTPRVIGQPISRVDGLLKVTGAATYTAEHLVAGLVHGLFVGSAIAKGKVLSIDSTKAKALPGVTAVLTHADMPKLKPIPSEVDGIVFDGEGGLIEMMIPMQDDRIHYTGQAIAIVIAETLEQAQFAATLLNVHYRTEVPELDFYQAKQRSEPENYCGIQPLQLSKGNAERARRSAEIQLELEYQSPVHTHNAIELLSTIARWEGNGDKECLHLHDTTRVLKTLLAVVSHCLDMPEANIRIISKYIGGAFGSKAWTFGMTMMVAVAARLVGHPLKVEWTRQQAFELAGHRPATWQTVRLGASKQGKLTSLEHVCRSHTSMVSGFPEACTGMTSMMYDVENLSISHDLRHLNLPTPLPMRGPGEMTGGWALECAMDELAYEVGRDPIDVRMENYAHVAPFSKRPFSSKHLRQCCERGRDLFGWDKRHAIPRSIKVGDSWVGLGFACNTHPAMQSPASASASIYANGKAIVRSATHELGNGAWTVFRQIAEDGLAMALDQVDFILGDSSFAKAPITAGSQTTASVGPAVLAACCNALDALKKIASTDSQSPFHGHPVATICAYDGKFYLERDPSVTRSYAEILQSAGQTSVEVLGESTLGKERKEYEFYSFGAVFAEVRVDTDTGTIRVPRVVGVYDVGRLINPKTAHSQLMGGVIFALGATLTEESYFDTHSGRAVIRNLADYHVPSCADTPDITIECLGIPDPYIGALGAHGVGECGVNGVPAAISNAVFNATGKRIRQLPMTVDKML